ncbi:MAG TPA: diguanylate cyclase [Candidatus Deferrimicrobiaceae bacterium]
MSRSVLVARPVWPVLRRVGEELSAAGYAVEYAGAWDALLSDRIAPERCAAVLLGDYGAPAEEEEILRRFRGRDGGPGVPVIVVGGQNAAQRAGRLRAAGADLVIAADLPPEEILDQARPLLAYGELYHGASKAFREMRDQAMVDGLTGLPNRRHFVLELARTVEMARRIGRPLSCIVSDIDDLQDVNEARGHSAGDRVIRQFGEILKKAKRSYDGVARLGGDEFAWLLVDTGPEQALQAARRAHRMVGEGMFDGADSPLRLTATFGVASLIPGEEWTAASLMENADRALYWGKESGKNMVRCYPPEKEE